MTPLRQRVLDELQRRNYAKDTARAYVLAIKQFAEYFGKSPERPSLTTPAEIATVQSASPMPARNGCVPGNRNCCR